MKTNQTKPIGISMFGVRCWMFDVLLILLLLAARGSASSATRYVWQSSPSPTPPYTNWTTASHAIQDAVDAAQMGIDLLSQCGNIPW